MIFPRKSSYEQIPKWVKEYDGTKKDTVYIRNGGALEEDPLKKIYEQTNRKNTYDLTTTKNEIDENGNEIKSMTLGGIEERKDSLDLILLSGLENKNGQRNTSIGEIIENVAFPSLKKDGEVLGYISLKGFKEEYAKNKISTDLLAKIKTETVKINKTNYLFFKLENRKLR